MTIPWSVIGKLDVCTASESCNSLYQETILIMALIGLLPDSSFVCYLSCASASLSQLLLQWRLHYWTIKPPTHIETNRSCSFSLEDNYTNSVESWNIFFLNDWWLIGLCCKKSWTKFNRSHCKSKEGRNLIGLDWLSWKQ